MAKQPSSALEAEALGLEFIEVTFRGHAFRVPLDVDSWPLEGIARCLAMREATGEIVVLHSVLTEVLRRLLGPPQWSQFMRVAPKRRHLVAASQALAEAAGFPARDEYDRVFGALPWLLGVIAEWPDKVESDLDQFWNIDYGQRFVLVDGRRRLTLRKIHARLINRPLDSAVSIAMNGGNGHRTGAELVLMDLFQAMTGQPHPSRPKTAEQREADRLQVAQLAKARADHQERMAKRESRQASSRVDNAKANAKRAMRRGAQAHAEDQD